MVRISLVARVRSRTGRLEPKIRALKLRENVVFEKNARFTVIHIHYTLVANTHLTC